MLIREEAPRIVDLHRTDQAEAARRGGGGTRVERIVDVIGLSEWLSEGDRGSYRFENRGLWRPGAYRRTLRPRRSSS